MKEIQLDKLKEIQLDILSSIHNFCVENNIKYTISDGTLIGAIRHKGYIPWDDDIDISLLREDFNKLEQTFPKIFKDKYIFKTLKRDTDWDRTYGKIYDNSTILIEEVQGNNIQHIGIDVFPLDYVPDEEKSWIQFNKKRRFLQLILQGKSVKINSSRSILKNLVLFVSKSITIFFKKRRIALYIDSMIQEFNSKKHKFVFENSLGLILKNRIPVEAFNDYFLVNFEDRKFMCIRGYDDYLKASYGDYMKLPPEEKRVSHHAFRAYLKED